MAVKELSFAAAYSFADRVVRAVYDREDCLSDFFGAGTDQFIQKISHPQRDTLVHDLIRNLNRSDLEHSTGHVGEVAIPEYITILRNACISVPTWLNEDEFSEHERELDALLGSAVGVLVHATFHLLFSDREFLVAFQDMVSEEIMRMDPSTSPKVFRAHGVLKRPKHIPSWLLKAVFLRDKGRCQSCFVDLTGTLAVEPVRHLDHIRPLAVSGSNDATNFQLQCSRCNQSKGGGMVRHKFRTLTFW